MSRGEDYRLPGVSCDWGLGFKVQGLGTLPIILLTNIDT